jgi:hypothetical protein
MIMSKPLDPVIKELVAGFGELTRAVEVLAEAVQRVHGENAKLRKAVRVNRSLALRAERALGFIEGEYAAAASRGADPCWYELEPEDDGAEFVHEHR